MTALGIGAVGLPLGAALLAVATAVTLPVIRGGIKAKVVPFCGRSGTGRNVSDNTPADIRFAANEVTIFLPATGVPDLHEE
jgi:hypothetical protein